MNHPSYRELQDYLESETNSKLIRTHLDHCERCSLIVAQMAKVDILVLKTKELKVSESTKKSIFMQASTLLEAKRNQAQKKQSKKEVRIQKKDEFIQRLSRLNAGALQELRAPLLQSVFLTVLIIVFTKVSTTHRKIEKYKIIENDFSVTYSENQGDSIENY